MGGRFREWLVSYAFILPFALIFFLFLGFPFLYALFLSFHRVTDFYDVFGSLRFVGLGNYLLLLRAPEFWWALAMTFYYGFLLIPLSLALSLALAVLVREVRGRLGQVFRAAFFLPYVLDVFVVGVVWTFLYAPRYGLAAVIARAVGLTALYEHGFLGSPVTAMPSVAFAMALKGAGLGMVLFIAALDRIDPEIYEAAALDGAVGWPRLRHITLPLLKPVTLFLVVIGIIGAFSAFAEFFAMTGGGPQVLVGGHPLGATKVTGYLLFEHLTNLRLGLAAALSFLLLLLTLGLSALSARILREAS